MVCKAIEGHRSGAISCLYPVKLRLFLLRLFGHLCQERWDSPFLSFNMTTHCTQTKSYWLINQDLLKKKKKKSLENFAYVNS
jgi:hypothetical protein